MINHKYKCIFIHIPKTGGSSIESTLDGRDWWHWTDNLNDTTWSRDGEKRDDLVNPHTSILKHINVEEARKAYFEEWRAYYKFTIVRNPYDWIFSCYRASLPRMSKWLGINSFEQYLDNHPMKGHMVREENWGFKWGIPQTRWLTPFCRYWMPMDDDHLVEKPMINNYWSDKGNDELGLFPNATNRFNQPINDIFVIKFEQLQEGYDLVCEVLDIPKHTLQHCNPSNKPKIEWTNELKEKVYQLYEEDFINFNYEK